MTEPLSLLPLRLMHTAKELAGAPQRTTLALGRKKARRVFFLYVPTPCLFITQLPLTKL